jgi:tetratricopeptide (TPR) repeat protein
MMAGARSKTNAFVAIGPPATASAQSSDIKARLGNYSAAQSEEQEFDRLVEAYFGADHPYYAVALNKRGLVYRAQGKYEEAETLLKRALAIREKTLGASHPDVAQTLTNLANVYSDQGKYGDAEGFYTRAR